MSMVKKTGIIVGGLCFVALVATNGYAQEIEEGSNYQPDLKPGIRYHSNNNGSSALAEAARTGQSVRISGTATSKTPTESLRQTYTVKDGDTLWDICTEVLGDPYVWPRIWSYNTNITNPHWIYPGDVLWLVPPVMAPMQAGDSSPQAQVQQMASRVMENAILHRNRGYVDKEVLEKSGVVRGSQKDVMLLSQYDEAYVEFENNRDIQVGDEFAAFQILKPVKAVDDPDTEVGKLVEILGVVRVTSFDKNKGIARVVIDETIQPIERGTMVGPVHRRFEMVPAVTNQRELKGNIVAHLDPGILFATYQVVFVDKGRDDGVKEGNRFFAIKKRDFYRESQKKKDDHDGYPFEVLAEMRVLEVRPKTSTCLVTAATHVLEDGAVVEMVKGY